MLSTRLLSSIAFLQAFLQVFLCSSPILQAVQCQTTQHPKGCTLLHSLTKHLFLLCWTTWVAPFSPASDKRSISIVQVGSVQCTVAKISRDMAIQAHELICNKWRHIFLLNLCKRLNCFFWWQQNAVSSPNILLFLKKRKICLVPEGSKRYFYPALIATSCDQYHEQYSHSLFK